MSHGDALEKDQQCLVKPKTNKNVGFVILQPSSLCLFTRGATCRSAGMTSVSESRRSNGRHRLSVTTNDRTTNCSIALVSIRESVTDSSDLRVRRRQRTSADLHGRGIQVQ